MTDPVFKIQPKRPLMTRDVLAWIVARDGETTLRDIVERFEISQVNAGVRLLRLFRGGYLKRQKGKSLRVYLYSPTALGRRLVEKGGK